MNKNTVINVVALLAIFAPIIWYVAMRPAPAKAPVVATATLPAGGYTEHAAYYDILTDYASSTPLLKAVGAPADTAAVALMQNFVGDTVAQFKSDGNFANLTADDIKTLGFDQGSKEKLQIVYLRASSPHTLSYIFTVYEDTLGAHGNMFFKTFTFDTTSGVPLALPDIFSSGADYLGTLSSTSRAKLPDVIGKSFDMTFINGGTTPEDKNFANFFFDNQYLIILFSPYAVGPYSSGPQTLRIPVSDLSSILKSEYR